MKKIVRDGIVDADGYGGFVISEVSGELEGDFDDGPCEAQELPSYTLFRDGDGGFIMQPLVDHVFDPNVWDGGDDANGALVPMPEGCWQMILLFKVTIESFRVVQGQRVYSSLVDVKSACDAGEFPSYDPGMACGDVSEAYAVQQGCTDLAVSTTCIALKSGIRGN